MPAVSITNVSVFGANGINSPSTFAFVGSPGCIIDAGSYPDVVIDGDGCTLLPGFIDSKVDADSCASSLPLFTASGVTTVIDSGSATVEIMAMRAATLRNIRLPSYLATGSAIGAKEHEVAGNSSYRSVERIATPAEAERCVLDRVTGSSQPDYIRIIMDQPGLSHDALMVAVATAHQHGRIVIGHASQASSYRLALETGIDVVTPVPVDGPLDSDVVRGLAEKKIAVVPTLCFLRKVIAEAHCQDYDFAHSMTAVRVLHEAGVQICAGTSSNQDGRMAVQFGGSIHEELRLLVQAGLSNREALQTATYVPARVWRLRDRGALELGCRADLMLIEGNPLEDLDAADRIRRVWVAGVEV